jgi:uncharacterized membrane protein YdjX (TVP38/TMEM64 family)
VIAALVAWAVWSYAGGGLLFALINRTDGVTVIEALRRYVLSWGMLAPVVYIAVVIVEVLVAPIPGTLLYAPAGAIWGGFVGGTLSLTGNVLGATIACWLAGAFGQRWVERHHPTGRIADLRARLRHHGAWLVFLLRVNPLTSADLVSYAAGLAGVPPRQVALGTFCGMLPHCYVQAYLAQALFDFLPAGPLFLVIGLVVVAVVALLFKR